MINIPNVTIKPAAEFSAAYWETAEQIIEDLILVGKQLRGTPLILECDEHTIICTDPDGQFICQVFMPSAEKNGSRFIRETLAGDLSNNPEMNCLFWYYGRGIRITGAAVDITLPPDVSEDNATISFCLANGADVSIDFNKVQSFTVDCEDPGVNDKTWTIDFNDDTLAVISYM